jgi:hypothetical protein
MDFKIIARPSGLSEAILLQTFSAGTFLEASKFHGDLWNDCFAHTDRFRSSMYRLCNRSCRWLRVETIC